MKKPSCKTYDVVPKVTRMTDGNGKYAGLEVIPGYLDGDIYIYSSYIRSAYAL